MFDLAQIRAKCLKSARIRRALIALAAVLIVVAWCWDVRVGVASSLIPIFLLMNQLGKAKVRQAMLTARAAAIASRPAVADQHLATPSEADAETELSLPETMLRQQRYALLVRSQITETLSEELRAQSNRLLWDRMGLVPEGNVAVASIFTDNEFPPNVWVDPVLLDRHCVSNQEFFEFVIAGGYQQPALWDAEVVSGLLDFVDTTGAPGPRFWVDGGYPHELASHPVVGVSWYEAAAYARWVGKRLPCDAEWVKSGSWPIATGNGSLAQRKYPWGNTMDRSRTNLWGSGPQTTVPVGDYASGVSVSGLYQLVGNVWEWTSTSFDTPPPPRRLTEETAPPIAEVPMKSIRGGAFDTYFDAQATCHFQSGERVLARKHNIGFRCALSACDVANLFFTPNPTPAEALQEALA